MQSEWEKTTLGQVTTWFSGGTPKKGVNEFWDGTIPWISANSMYGTRYYDSGIKITDAGLAAGSRLAPKNSILLLVRGGALHSRIPVGIALRDVAFNQDVKALLPDVTKISPWYLLFWMMSQERFVLENVVEFTGIGAGKLDTSRMQALKLMLPSLGEQQRILDLIKSIDDDISLNRQINTTLEAIAQTLFKSWFIDFDPVRAKMGGLQPEAMDETTAALFPSEFAESTMGLIPKEWKSGTLAEFATLNPESWSAKNHPSTVCYIDLANAKENRIEQFIEYDFDAAPSRARRILRSGDSIIGTVRPGNRSFAYILTNRANLTGSTGFAVLRPKHPSFAEYIYLACTNNENIERLANLADGGAYPAVRSEVVLQTPSVCPPEPLLKAFSEIVAPLFTQIHANQNSENQLVEIRDTLLPKLMSGQLRIPDSQTHLIQEPTS